MPPTLERRFVCIAHPLPLPAGEDEASLRTYLEGLSLDGAPQAELASYLNQDFRRFIYTLGLVPEQAGRLLEIGANPYFLRRHYSGVSASTICIAPIISESTTAADARP